MDRWDLLYSLQILKVQRNKIAELPSVGEGPLLNHGRTSLAPLPSQSLFCLPQLQEVHADRNCLGFLPETICRAPSLKVRAPDPLVH